MMIYKLLASSLLVTIPVLARFIHAAIPLKSDKLLLTDVIWPLYAVALVLVSKRFFNNSFLPHYLLLLSVLAILISLWLMRSNGGFSYGRWGKLFWRWSFFLTLLSYLLTLGAVFLLA